MGGDAARAGVRKDASLRRFAPRVLHRHESLDDAFERFYRKHVAEVYQYALAVLGNSADAEDVTQQTFLNAYRAFRRGGQPTKPHNWLIKIAHNVCRMRWRQSGRRPHEVPLDNAPEPAAPEHDENLSLDEVLTALARLPLNQRAAIVMREVEDRSYAEIAEVLGVTVPAVEALLFRGRGSLRARRNAIVGTLGVVPLPASLASFFGGGSGVIAAGGAALGSEVALKVAAVVATGAVAGGLGYKSVDAVATPDAGAKRVAQVRHEPRAYTPSVLRRSSRAAAARSAIDVAAFQHSRAAVRSHGALRKEPTNDPVSAGGAPAASEQQGAASPSPQPQPASAAASTVGAVTKPVTSVTTVVPPSTTVATPVLTVTVTVPTVPLPPPPVP